MQQIVGESQVARLINGEFIFLKEENDSSITEKEWEEKRAGRNAGGDIFFSS